jgi:hypothetical protein
VTVLACVLIAAVVLVFFRLPEAKKENSGPSQAMQNVGSQTGVINNIFGGGADAVKRADTPTLLATLDFPDIGQLGTDRVNLAFHFTNRGSQDFYIRSVRLQQKLLLNKEFRGQENYTRLCGSDMASDGMPAHIRAIPSKMQDGSILRDLDPHEVLLNGSESRLAAGTVPAGKTMSLMTTFYTKPLDDTANISVLCPTISFLDEEGRNRFAVCAGMFTARILLPPAAGGILTSARPGPVTLLPDALAKGCFYP